METQQLFNIENFNIKLDTEYLGRNFVYCEEIDSTNNFLISDKEFQEHGTVVFAEFQSEGKGRQERNWVSNKGQNLLFSILLTEDVNSENINHYNLGAAVAVSEALENLYQLKPEMKWPNDVLVSRKKISGILCESAMQGKRIKKLVIGIGVNVNQVNFAGKYKIPPTSIRNEIRRPVNRERLLSEFLNIFEEIIEELKKEPRKVLDAWRAKCKLIGEKIWIREGEKEWFGLFKDITPQGYLILQVGGESKIFTTGDLILKK